jgi:hypothetical protein
MMLLTDVRVHDAWLVKEMDGGKVTTI